MIIKNINLLKEDYIPPTFVHRDREIAELNRIFYVYRRYQTLTNNIYIYGPAGTGKTQIVLKYLRELELPYTYCSCREYNTTYQVLKTITEQLTGRQIPSNKPTHECFSLIKKRIKESHVIVLDDIQSVVKDNYFDKIIFGLSRIGWNISKQCMLIMIGNILPRDLKSNLASHTVDGLKLRYIYFPKYNAEQLKDILIGRENAFYKLPVQAINYISAYVAQQWGSARLAIDLLRESCILAEMMGKNDVDYKDVEKSISIVEEKELEDILTNLPIQALLVCEAIANISLPATPSQIYGKYVELCNKNGFRPLTLRRLSDILCDLEGEGLINTKIEFRGRYGRKKIVLNYCLDKRLHNKYIKNKLDFIT